MGLGSWKRIVKTDRWEKGAGSPHKMLERGCMVWKRIVKAGRWK